MSRPLEEITGGNARFEWSEARQNSFQKLRSTLLSAPVLQLADVQKSFRIITDASDFAVAGVLLQQDDDESWHPVAYCSRKLQPAARSYTVAERETLAVVFALKSWRIYLFRHFDVFTDNMTVVHLQPKPNLTKREARWAEFLADYNFSVYHKQGTTNTTDALSRRPDYHFHANAASSSGTQINAIEYTLELNKSITRCIAEAYPKDNELYPTIRKLKCFPKDGFHDRYCLEKSDCLFLKASPNNRLCIPKCKVRLQFIQ